MLDPRNMTQKQLAIPIALILIISIGYVAADTVVNENPDGYDLDVSTEEPVDVRPTEATFVAEVTELDDIYDAALIYWNYTDGENEYKGPANIAFEQGETVKSYQPNLDADTELDVEAYAEPVVWEDDTLADNFIEKGLEDEEREGADAVPADDADAMEAVADDADAMEAVAESSTSRDAVKNSQAAVDELNSRTSDVVSGELIGDGGPSSGSPVYERSQGVYIERVVHDSSGSNSGSSTIWIDYGDEVISYDSSSDTNEVVAERIAFAVYHEHEFDNTGIDVIEAYEW